MVNIGKHLTEICSWWFNWRTDFFKGHVSLRQPASRVRFQLLQRLGFPVHLYSGAVHSGVCDFLRYRVRADLDSIQVGYALWISWRTVPKQDRMIVMVKMKTMKMMKMMKMVKMMRRRRQGGVHHRDKCHTDIIPTTHAPLLPKSNVHCYDSAKLIMSKWKNTELEEPTTLL